LSKRRPPIKKSIKEELYRQAGNKCANPGCMNYRTHIHHIQEWHVVKTHDEKHMIAVCPSCHDEIHHGKLKITDETIYKWKDIKRSTLNRDHIYIEPNTESKLLLGSSVGIESPDGLTVFELTKTSKLTYKVEDGEIFLLDLSITNLKRKEILKVTHNHIKYSNDEHITYTRRPGRFRITTKRLLDFIPIWSIAALFKMQPEFKIDDGELLLLDMEVISPGVVKAEGFWSRENAVVIITNDSVNLLPFGWEGPASFSGMTFSSSSHITSSIFGI